METNVFDIRSGMDVYACDGRKIGAVGNIFSGRPESRDTAGTPYSDIGGGQPSGPAATDTSVSDGGVEATPSTGTLQAERVPVPSIQGTMNSGAETTGLPQAAPGATPAVDDVVTGAEGGGVSLTPSNTKYFEVKHGGFLGFGGECFYVPFSAVDAVAPGDSVTLACTGEQCGQLYAEKPAPLAPETAGTAPTP